MQPPAVNLTVKVNCAGAFSKCCPRKVRSKCCEPKPSPAEPSHHDSRHSAYESDSVEHRVKKVAKAIQDESEST